MTADTTLNCDRALQRRLVTVVVALAVIAVAVFFGVRSTADTATTYTVTFPPGSTLRIDPDVFAGISMRTVAQTVWLEFAVGDTLVVTNDDLFTHVLWAIRVRPGETVAYTFTQPGTFTGECTFDLEVFLEVRET
jgi:hypothetical protein